MLTFACSRFRWAQPTFLLLIAMSSANYEYGPSADRARKLLERRSRKRWRRWLCLGIVGLLALAALIAWNSYRGAERKAASRAGQLGGRVTWSQDRERHVIALSFAGTVLTDDQLKSFIPWWWHLPGLVDLDLRGTAISDEGLAHLSGAGIKNLILDNTKVSSSGLGLLAQCPSLSSVSLSNTLVDDAGIEHLASLPGLRMLDLEGAPITDDALRRLESVSSLQYLRLGGNRGVTDDGVARLQAALPELKVTRKP
jgi:hypothetical protein